MAAETPTVLPSIVPSWSRVIRTGDITDPTGDTPVRVVFVSPAGPGAWVDTDLETALLLVTKLSDDLNLIVQETEGYGA